MENKWYSKSVAEVFADLKSQEAGLAENEASSRIKELGSNKLPESKPDNFLIIFLRQFQGSLIYILLVAAIIVFLMGEYIDGFVIMAVLVFNAIIGSIQEGKAQNTLSALKNFTETKTTVLRGGREIIISDKEIVPGDVIILAEGEKIPADARVIIANNLKIDESAMSGESVPVNKTAEPLGKNFIPVAERKNLVFKGTNVLAGSGVAVVFATGINTEIGKIAKKIASIDTETPLKKNIRHLSRAIIISVAILNIILFAEGVISGRGAKEMFTTLVSLSVSIIPEGLPVAMTLILATGVWRMSKRSALVKRLQAVEALGQAQIIAVDKTGTITKNEMVVQKVFAGGKYFDISGTGYEPKGDIKMDGAAVEPLSHQELIFSVKNAALCSNARIIFQEKENKWVVAGDPTEAALLVLAKKIGFHKNALDEEFLLLSEFPFDYRLKYKAVLRKIVGKNTLIVMGAPENILEISNKIWRSGKVYVFAKKEKDKIKAIMEKMSEEGLRVVALSINKNFKGAIEDGIKGGTFVAFFGMKDALRQEVPDAMSRAVSAGMKVVMITGDHKITARAVAMEAGIYKNGDEILTGEDLEKTSDNDLAGKINSVSVFARVSPEHKLRIVEAFKKSGKIIAMTGDGVNDAPSLVAADLGVAMGKIGTEVAREASDIVLLDDNFGSIVSAIEEGRSIYKTIKKVVLYLISTSLGEVLIIGSALFMGFPMPLLPTQIIWLNFVTDGFLTVALAMDPREEGLLKNKFKKPGKYLLDFLSLKRMFLMAIVMMIGTLFMFRGSLGQDLVRAQTIALCIMAAFQWFNALNCRSETSSVFNKSIFSNKFLLAALAAVVGLQILAVYNPYFQKILHTGPLSLYDWALIVGVSFSIIIAEEIRKLVVRLIKPKTIDNIG